MTKVAKRYLISGAIGMAAMLTAFGIVLFKAAEKMQHADGVITPSPVAAALALPTEPAKDVAQPSTEAPPAAPAADLANAFGAALGVEVKKSDAKSDTPHGTPSVPAKASEPSSSPDTLDLGSKKEREARFGGHQVAPAGVRQIGGQERASKSGGKDDKITFETELK